MELAPCDLVNGTLTQSLMAQTRSVPLSLSLFHPLGTPDAVGSSLRTDLSHAGTKLIRCEALEPAGKMERDFPQGCAVTGPGEWLQSDNEEV